MTLSKLSPGDLYLATCDLPIRSFTLIDPVMRRSFQATCHLVLVLKIDRNDVHVLSGDKVGITDKVWFGDDHGHFFQKVS